MKPKPVIAIAALAILFLLAVAVFRGQTTPRELILLKNGRPLANLKADILSHCGGAEVVHTTTDQNGKLDLSVLPAATEQISMTLWDGANSLDNRVITLPTRGSLTIDHRGRRSISTTKITHFDLGFFKYTSQEIQDWRSAEEPPAKAK